MTVLYYMTGLWFMMGYGGDILCVISVVIKQFSEKKLRLNYVSGLVRL